MSKTDLATIPNDDMWTLSKAFRAEGTLGNDRFGYNQMATTLVKQTSPDATNIFQYFGTGDQAHIQRRDASIANRIYGIKDSDFPAKDLAITGTSKTISSDGIFHLTGDTDTVCSAENVPAWYADVKDVSTLDTAAGDFIKVVGRALVTGGDAYFTLYRPEDLSCPVNGKGEVLKMVRGCTGGHSVIAAGEGLSTAPVMDSKGNIYVGVSNLATDGELDIEASDDEERSGVDNILKIGSTDIESSGEAAGTNIKSWRELRRDN